MHRVRVISLAVVSCLLAAGLLIAAPEASAQTHKSGQFTGPKANTGFVTHSKNSAKNVLTLSDDFQVPDTPDPHWQVVDSKGTVYLLERLDIKDDIGMKSMGASTNNTNKGGKRVLVNRSIVLPSYVQDVVTVRIWCAWAEANLGEAKFPTPVK